MWRLLLSSSVRSQVSSLQHSMYTPLQGTALLCSAKTEHLPLPGLSVVKYWVDVGALPRSWQPQAQLGRHAASLSIAAQWTCSRSCSSNMVLRMDPAGCSRHIHAAARYRPIGLARSPAQQSSADYLAAVSSAHPFSTGAMYQLSLCLTFSSSQHHGSVQQQISDTSYAHACRYTEPATFTGGCAAACPHPDAFYACGHWLEGGTRHG